MQAELDFYANTDCPSFNAFCDEQTDLFIESHQDDADNEYVELLHGGLGTDAVSAGMQQWWDQKIKDLQVSLALSFHEKERRLARRRSRRMRQRQERRIAQLKQSLAETELKLYQAIGDLEIEQGLTAQLRDTTRCHNCNLQIAPNL